MNNDRYNKGMKNMLFGITAGIICGMFSAGGGLILVPIFLHFFKMNEKEARANALFCVLPMVITTAIVYNKSSYIHWDLAIRCAIGGVIGGIIGGSVLNKINVKYLKIMFIIFLLYAGFRMIFL